MKNMIVRFWGVRGSIPAPLTSQEVKLKILSALKGVSDRDLGDEGALERYVNALPQHIKGTYGGDTSCVQVASGDTTCIFDAGSGIRRLGAHLMESNFSKGRGTAHLFLSHTHWDHIQGLPFFLPAYVPGNRMVIYSPHQNVEERLKLQQEPSYFPVSLEAMEAGVEFLTLAEGETTKINDLRVSNIGLNHPGGSFAYRVEREESSFVYATDTNIKNLPQADQERFISFLSQAKVAVFDAQYTAEEAAWKDNWGHGSPFTSIDMALRANVKILVLFHHEPAHDDRMLHETFQRARKYLDLKRQGHPCTAVMAHEGLQLTV